jgi:hypothetical protein
MCSAKIPKNSKKLKTQIIQKISKLLEIPKISKNPT